jgi:hypothetical protein
MPKNERLPITRAWVSTNAQKRFVGHSKALQSKAGKAKQAKQSRLSKAGKARQAKQGRLSKAGKARQT